jgi:hypothetical protein
MQYKVFFTLFAALLMAGTTANAQQRPAGPSARPSVNPAERIEGFFNRLDKNQDGTLSKDEIPETLSARLSSMDRDRDGAITSREFVARFQQRSGSPAARENNAPQRPQAGRGGGGRSGGRSGSQQGQQNRQHDGSTPSRGQAQQGQRGPQQQGRGGPQRHDDGRGGSGAQQGQRGPQQQGRGGPGAQQGQRGPQQQGRGGPGAQQGQRGPQQPDRGNRDQGQSNEDNRDYQGFIRRIRAAVESGAMTRQEAAEKINEFRRSRGGEDRGGAEDPRQGDGQRERDGNRESNQPRESQRPPGRDR